MTAATAGGTSHALNLAEAIPLLHGLVDEVARALGVRVLFIKGPILTAQGLRSTHQSVDVDVLVDPERLSDLQQGLERLGWAVRVPSTSAQVLPLHSATYAHPVWPCEVDVHDRFPGFLAEPQATFEALWAHRTSATVAGREVPCLEPVAHFAIACLHVLRDLGSPGKRDELDRLVEVAKAMFDTDQRSRLGVLTARTDSLGTLRPVLEVLGLPNLASTTTVGDLTDWRVRASSPGVRSVGWVAQLGRTPLRRWPATLVHALLLTEAEIRDAQPHAARGRWGLLRARLRRLGLGLRDVPRACMIIRRARRESVAGR
jgi:hypothetical protein